MDSFKNIKFDPDVSKLFIMWASKGIATSTFIKEIEKILENVA